MAKKIYFYIIITVVIIILLGMYVDNSTKINLGQISQPQQNQGVNPNPSPAARLRYHPYAMIDS